MAGWLFAFYKYCHRIPDLKQQEIMKREVGAEFEAEKELEKSQTLEERYRATLKEELGWIKMLGSPDIPTLPVHLLDTFVSLRISETWRSETRFDLKEEARPQERERDFTPEQIIKRAFANRRMLLTVGDPGSGKIADFIQAVQQNKRRLLA